MQKKIKYHTMVSAQSHGKLSDFINKKYQNSLVWPIIWYRKSTKEIEIEIESITFEVNKYNSNNTNINEKHCIVKSMENIPTYKTDYTIDKELFRIQNLKNISIPEYIKESMDHNYEVSHQYVTSVLMKPPIYTIDVDYLWETASGVEALEVSTFYSKISSKKTGEYLISKFIEHRASKKNAHQFKLLAKACSQIFKARLRMVFFQTEKETSNIVQGSNVVWFELDLKQAERIHNGELPDNICFQPIKEFLKNSL
ncbi:hypothetical protein E0M27_18690 [Bacillus mycoides]|uniref:hypothetical protein n=1 Tax=Bacillus mycoides TaxID=1405 RepID=UPI0010405A59|nr:hypothetical protein [Bacillus mycoides]TBX54825.1 hypothetical protein E0M27_18690 [Bacillus mycoides]